jgi:3-deoxy-manno-octulosonate cytidylyltransferase (CMP-KDO synthetase)
VNVVIAIPARIGSTRLPEKALADICGEPMVVRVWRRCAGALGGAGVLVATDDERIRDVVRAAGGAAVLTAPSHRSGTDRIAEAVRGEQCDLVINVQGDEPFVEAAPLEALVAAFAAGLPLQAATLATPIRHAAELFNPAVVKVLVGRDGYAVYFSRHPIPWSEGLHLPESGSPPVLSADAIDTSGYLRHLGIYAYRPEFLQRFTKLEPGWGERSERLEQLRILEHGHRIRVVVTPWESLAVDTPEDLERARARASREPGCSPDAALRRGA